MPPSSNSLAYVLLFLTLVNLILNFLYRHQLFALGLQFIQQFQQSEHYIITFLLLIPTILIDPVFVLVVTFTLVVMIKTKERTFMTVMFILFNAFLSCLLKTFYADPRPFWVHQQIKTIGIYCPLQYGNPSGHSWFAVIVAFGVIIEYWGVGKNNRWVYTSIALIILVPLSRMYLGAHSLNQVLQGLYLGFIMVVLYQFSFLKQSIQSYLYKFTSLPKWKHLTYCLHILYLVGYALNSPAFNPNAKPVPQDYIDNIASQCPKQFNPVYLNFRMLLVNSFLVNFATGIAVGFGQVNLAAKGRLYLSGQWLINDQRYKPCVGYLYFFAIEVGWLIAGVLPSAVIIYLFNFNEPVIFIFGNIGVYLAGYLYTSRSFKTLFAKQVIRQEIV